MPIGVQAAHDMVLRVGVTQTTEQVQNICAQQRLTTSENHLLRSHGYHLGPQTSELVGAHLIRQGLAGGEVTVGALKVDCSALKHSLQRCDSLPYKLLISSSGKRN